MQVVLQTQSGLYTELGTDSSHQLGRIHLSNFCQPSNKWNVFPELSGVKAKQVRYLIPPILELCKDLQGDSPYRTCRTDCVSNLNKMYHIMDSEGLHPQESAYMQYKKATEKCLICYTKLAKMTTSQKLLQWNAVHKHHLSCHMIEQFRFTNSRFVSTYTGETMVGLMSSLAHSCLNGTPGHLVPTKVAWRYRLGLHLRLAHGDLEVMESDEEL